MYMHKDGCTKNKNFGTNSADEVRCCLAKQISEEEILRNKEEGMEHGLKIKETPAKVVSYTSLWLNSPTMPTWPPSLNMDIMVSRTKNNNVITTIDKHNFLYNKNIVSEISKASRDYLFQNLIN